MLTWETLQSSSAIILLVCWRTSLSLARSSYMLSSFFFSSLASFLLSFNVLGSSVSIAVVVNNIIIWVVFFFKFFIIRFISVSKFCSIVSWSILRSTYKKRKLKNFKSSNKLYQNNQFYCFVKLAFILKNFLSKVL